ncbi:hypothetical protein R54767_04506 [Paraburkholderia gardini]|uniref:Uncharacterized protein n=1 Tax=Paraburkholderia gardini TaxID=2823469 RepID=A0ABM8U978_9BURK|nr:hypothetical protein R54767_04506 [Paraburkholderia gardini]
MSKYRDDGLYIPTRNIERIDRLYRTMLEMTVGRSHRLADHAEQCAHRQRFRRRELHHALRRRVYRLALRKPADAMLAAVMKSLTRYSGCASKPPMRPSLARSSAKPAVSLNCGAMNDNPRNWEAFTAFARTREWAVRRQGNQQAFALHDFGCDPVGLASSSIARVSDREVTTHPGSTRNNASALVSQPPPAGIRQPAAQAPVSVDRAPVRPRSPARRARHFAA